MPDKKDPTPIATPAPAPAPPSASGEAIAAVINQSTDAINKLNTQSAGEIDAAKKERDAALAKLKHYQDQEDAQAQSIYDGLSDEQKQLADAVKGSMPRDGYKAYLDLLVKNAAAAKAAAGGDDESAPGLQRGDNDDAPGDFDHRPGKYKVKYAEEIEDRLGISVQHLQHSHVSNDQSGMRVQLPLKQFKEILRAVPGKKLDTLDK